MIKKYDLVLLNEIWTNHQSAIDITGYESYCSHRKRVDNKARRLSGGVICYVKSCHTRGIKLVQNETSDILWLMLDKHYFGTKNEILLCLTYIPPEHSGGSRNNEDDMFDRIILDISKLSSLYDDVSFMVCGDLNGRTGSLSDFIEHDKAEYLPLPEDYIEDQVETSVRVNMDKVCNAQGKRLLELCKMCSLRITNGRIGADKNIGRYTCYTHNGTSTVDYLLCSPSIMSYITEFTVRDQNEFSDHCPIDFSLLTHSEPQAEEVGQCSGKIVWDSNKCEDFMCNLVRTPSTSRFEEMMLVMNNVTVVSQHDIQLAVDCFTEGVRAAADPLFYRASGKSGHQRISSGTPWGDSQ